MHPFRRYIQEYVTLSQADWEGIAARLQRQEVKRGEVLLEEGKVCRHLYFVEKGLLHYYLWRDGISVTKFFTVAPYCFTSTQSFSRQKASKDNIAALEDCVLWIMSREDAYLLLDTMPAWSTFVRELISEVQDKTQTIMEALQSETAETRYREMLLRQPELLQRIPLKHLASFLGIAPQSLSRIRKKLLVPSRS